MITFFDIEDYIELISGIRTLEDIRQKRPSPKFYSIGKPIIRLARYDVNFVRSTAFQTIEGKLPLTDKQFELAEKIVRKYKKQLAHYNVTLPDAFSTRQPIRSVVREKKIFLENDAIVIKFPYNDRLITTIKQNQNKNTGRIYFDFEKKYWVFALTEPNVMWATNFGRENGFEIDQSLLDIENQILDYKNGTPYAIELDIEGDQLIIKNAASSMLDWLGDQGISMAADNLLQVAHYSGLLGFTLSKRVEDAIRQSVPESQLSMFLSSQPHLVPSKESFDKLMAYAQTLNKQVWIFCAKYETYQNLADYASQHGKVLLIDSTYAAQNKNSINEDLESGQYDIVLVTATGTQLSSIILNLNKRIGITVSTMGLVPSQDMISWLHNTEKVVYYCDTVKDN